MGTDNEAACAVRGQSNFSVACAQTNILSILFILSELSPVQGG
jgi:hypothetical protein